MLIRAFPDSASPRGDFLQGAPQGDFLRGAPQGDFLRGAPQGDFLRGALHPGYGTGINELKENMMDFTLPEELRMLRETVARFVREELLPLERDVIRREAERGLTDAPLIDPDVEKELNRKAKEIGLYGIDAPEEHGGPKPRMLAKAG